MGSICKPIGNSHDLTRAPKTIVRIYISQPKQRKKIRPPHATDNTNLLTPLTNNCHLFFSGQGLLPAAPRPPGRRTGPAFEPRYPFSGARTPFPKHGCFFWSTGPSSSYCFPFACLLSTQGRARVLLSSYGDVERFQVSRFLFTGSVV